MRTHRPHGPRTTGWEADVLKIRALEMVLMLFYLEDLKQFILESIGNTDRFHGLDRLADGRSSRPGKKFELARAVLVSEGVISPAESEELRRLVDYRNTIGHQVQQLTVDVGAHSDLTKLDPKTFEPIPAYDYGAVDRVRSIRQKISRGMGEKFILSLSLNDVQFEAAENAYIVEIARLKKRVLKSMTRANKVIEETNDIIKRIPEKVIDALETWHPRHIKKKGALSKDGAECAFQLFEWKATPLAVAYLMRISHRAAAGKFRIWKASKARKTGPEQRA